MAILKTARKWTLTLTAILAAALVVGTTYERGAERQDRAVAAPTGSLFDIGGFRLHLDCTGSGSPTVVLEAGMGDDYLHWRRVQGAASAFTRVCSYDRAGLGWSDRSPHPRDAATIARELHTLLDRAGVSPPYLLVGHSFGGMYIRVYRALYPLEVQALILVDSTHPDVRTRAPAPSANDFRTMQKSIERRSWLMRLGVLRVAGLCGGGPAELRRELRAMECNVSSMKEQVAELGSFDQSAAETRAAGPLGDLPLIVVSEDARRFMAKNPGLPSAFDAMQDDLVHLSSTGCRIIATGSDHQIMLMRPDVIIDAIRMIIERQSCAGSTKAL